MRALEILIFDGHQHRLKTSKPFNIAEELKRYHMIRPSITVNYIRLQ